MGKFLIKNTSFFLTSYKQNNNSSNKTNHISRQH